MKKATLKDAQMRMLEILIEIDRICKKYNIKYWLDSGTLLGAIRHNGFIPWDDDLDIGMLREDYNKFLEVINSELNEKFICQTPDTDKLCQNAFTKIRDINSKIKSNNKNEKELGLFVDVFAYDSFTRKNIIYKKIYNTIILSKWIGDLKLKEPYKSNIKKNIAILFCKVTNLIYKIVPYEKMLRRIYKNALKSEIKETEKISYGVEVPFKEVINRLDVFPLKNHSFEGIEFPVPGKYENVLKVFFGEWWELPPKELQIPSHSENIYINN